MTRSTRPTLTAAAVLVATAVLAGCTTTVAGNPGADLVPISTEGPGSDPVAWADRLCGAVMSFAVPATTPPAIPPGADLPTVKRAVSDYLGTVLNGVQRGRSQLGAIGRSPVQGGNDAVGRAQSALEFLEQDFTGAKTAVDAADANNPESIMTALDQAQSTFDAITPPNPLADLSATPRLQKAAGRATQCQQLSALSATAPR